MAMLTGHTSRTCGKSEGKVREHLLRQKVADSNQDKIMRNYSLKIKQSEHRKTNKRQPNEVRAAIDYGIDVSMLIENLKRTPAERIKRHQIALETVEKLRKARHL